MGLIPNDWSKHEGICKASFLIMLFCFNDLYELPFENFGRKSIRAFNSKLMKG